MRATDDPTLRAAGYIHAAIVNLEVAANLLPDDHPVMSDLTKLLKRAKRVNRDVQTVWVDRDGDGNWVRAWPAGVVGNQPTADFDSTLGQVTNCQPPQKRAGNQP